MAVVKVRPKGGGVRLDRGDREASDKGRELDTSWVWGSASRRGSAERSETDRCGAMWSGNDGDKTRESHGCLVRVLVCCKRTAYDSLNALQIGRRLLSEARTDHGLVDDLPTKPPFFCPASVQLRMWYRIRYQVSGIINFQPQVTSSLEQTRNAGRPDNPTQ